MSPSTIARSSRPTCPACGFAVFNRRCPSCEKCGAALPASIVYTAAEITALRADERVEEQRRAERRAATRAAAHGRDIGAGSVGVVGSAAGGGDGALVDLVDLGDLLDPDLLS